MKKRANKYGMIFCILAAAIFMGGCGKNNSAGNSQNENGIKQEEAVFKAHSIVLPEYASFDGAYSDGDDLYYAAAKFDENSQQYETAFYALQQGETVPEIKFSLAKNQRIQGMTMDTEGNIYFLGYDEVSQDRLLYKVDQNGTSLLSIDLAEYIYGQEQIMIQGLSVDDEGRIVLFTSNQKIIVFDPKGNLLFEVKADGMIYNICNSGGNVFVAYQGSDGMEVRELDTVAEKLLAKLENNISGNQIFMAGDGKKGLLIATERSIYRYDIEEKETVKKFDWQTQDFTGITAGILLPYGENGILIINRDYSAFPIKTEATAFREVAEGETQIQEKTVLTLGALYPMQTGLSAEVVYFNKENPDYKIEIKNYNEDYTRLNTEVMAGNGPDLLILPFYRVEQLAVRGAIEDLNPYFAEDETIERGDFQVNILEAFESQEHLYGMPISFFVLTMVGKASILEDRSEWNLDELIAFAESAPEGKNIFDNTSKSGVLKLLKYANTDQLVDTDNTSSPVNRDLLMKILEFANQYEHDELYSDNKSLSGKIQEEPVLVLDSFVRQGHDYFGASGLFGEPAAYIGYPCEGGNGSLIQSNSIFAISSNSEHKDVAWDFISALLSEEVQKRMDQDYSTKGFQIRTSVLEAHLDWSLKNTSSYVLFTLNSSDYAQYKYNPEDLRKEDVEPIRNLIQNADTALRVSPGINQIIEEEAIFYFNGTKPLDQVVDVIENRVRTYVNEQK